MKLLLIEACELPQSHLHDGLALQFVEAKAFFQSALCILRCLALLDDMHHLVDVVRGNDETFQDVCPLFCLAEVILCTANGDFVTMSHKVADEVLQCEQLRTAFHESDAVHAEACLQRRHLEELVEHDSCIGIALQINHDTHAFAVALVVDIADAVNLLLANKLCDVLDELLLVHAVGYLAHDNLVVRVAVLNLSLGTDDDASPTRFVGIANALQAHDVCARREVRTLHILHQVIHRQVLVINECHTGINTLREVMCRYICCHTYSDACCSVDE